MTQINTNKLEWQPHGGEVFVFSLHISLYNNIDGLLQDCSNFSAFYFLFTSSAIRQLFSRMTQSRVKIIGGSHDMWQEIVSLSNRYVILFLHALISSKTQRNGRKRPPIFHLIIVVYDESADCAILTWHKHIPWRHFDWLSSEPL